jgi:hypothetical protein
MQAMALPERLAEAAGPILVKEVRQGLRAKAFATCFGLLLFACLVVALFAATQVGVSIEPLGPRYLALFFGAQSLVCLFVIPFMAYRSVSRELEEETWVLLALTGLSARHIAFGKASSSLLQAVLFASCCAPFVLFSYYLQGVDLLTLVVGLFLTFCACAFLVCGAVALGTEGVTRVGRRMTELIVLAILLACTAVAVGFGLWLAKDGSSLVVQFGFWIFVFCLAYGFLSSAWLLLEAAAANLALASEANTGPVRKVLVGQHLGALACAWVTVALPDGPDRWAVVVASTVASLMLVVTGFFLVSSRDGFPNVPNWRVTWTAPGALRGWTLLHALLFLDCLGWAGLHAVADSGRQSGMKGILAGPAYVGLYLNIAVLLGRAPTLERLGTKVATRAAFLAAVAVASVVLPVLSIVAGGKVYDVGANCLNPTLGMLAFLFYADAPEGALLVLWALFVSSIPLAYAQLKLRDTGRVG